MQAARGAGIAAPQIGESLALCVVHIADNPRYSYKPDPTHHDGTRPAGLFFARASELRPACRHAGFNVLPISAALVLGTWSLPWHHRDPFDRLLVAQASLSPEGLRARDPRRPLGRVRRPAAVHLTSGARFTQMEQSYARPSQ